MKYSELENFAKWFHQDFGVLFQNAEEGTNEYLKIISSKQKNILSVEIKQLLKEHPGKDHKGLKNAWAKLGAQWWSNKDLPLILNALASK